MVKVEKRDGSDERTILTGMIVDRTVLGRVSSIWERNLFSSRWCLIVAEWCIDFFQKFDAAPKSSLNDTFQEWSETANDESIVRLIGKFLGGLSDEHEALAEELNADHVIDLAGKYFNRVRLSRLAAEMDHDLATGQQQRAEDRLTKHRHVDVGGPTSINLLQDRAVIQQAFEERKSTLIEYPGRAGLFFADAFAPGNFISIEAPEKCGKSFLLLDIAWRAVEQRRRVAFFDAGDMGQNRMVKRFACRATKMPLYPQTIKIPVKMQRTGQSYTDLPKVKYNTKRFQSKLSWQNTWKAMNRTMQYKIKSKNPYLKTQCHPTGTLKIGMIATALDRWEQEGWSPDVVCIEEGSKVLTDRGLIAIENVACSDRLWDGENWVSHGGPIYKGEKDVIEYCGFVGTPDHEIWTECGWRTLESCAQLGLRIAKTGNGRCPLRIGRNYIRHTPRSSLFIHETPESLRGKKTLCAHQMCAMCKRKMDSVAKFEERHCQRVSTMFATEEVPDMVRAKIGGSEATLSESEVMFLQGLWCKRNRISLRDGVDRMCMDCREFGVTGQGYGDRSDQQRRTLRAGKFEMVYAEGKLLEHTQKSDDSKNSQVQTTVSEDCLCRFNNQKVFSGWDVSKTNCGSVEINSTKVRKSRVWDIRNAGPLHRFTVQGILVHNCIDYADILAPDVWSNDERDRINNTWMAMRALSQTYRVLVVTATQTNAKAYEGKLIGMSNFSGDKRKRAHVDGTFAINRNQTLRDRGLSYLKWVAVRDEETPGVWIAECRAIANLCCRSI